MKLDLKFVAGDFKVIPKEKKYLAKYFTTKIQKAFVSYVLSFGEYNNFVDHTGHYCQTRYLKIMYDRLLYIEDKYKQAKQSLDLDLLVKIESGKLK